MHAIHCERLLSPGGFASGKFLVKGVQPPPVLRIDSQSSALCSALSPHCSALIPRKILLSFSASRISFTESEFNLESSRDLAFVIYSVHFCVRRVLLHNAQMF